jgi:MFS family permease
MLKLLTKSKNTTHSCLHIFIATIFFAFHHYFILYINSSYLETLVPRTWVGLLYSLASLLTIFVLLKLSRIIEKFGILKTIIVTTAIDIIVLAIMILSDFAPLTLVCFIIYAAIPALILVCLDTAIEDTVKSSAMGKTRGILLTLFGSVAVASPLIVGGMISDGGFKQVYLFSLFFLILFLLIIISNRHRFNKANLTKIKGMASVREFFSIPDIRRIGMLNFALHFFFSWMIIYIPIYLNSEMGFSWSDIGIMISIALVPFIILEIPAGELADESLGEKEMLVGGMILMIIASLLFPTLAKGAFVIWTLVLLLGRIGASITETMVESYFFKKSKGKDELIEVFRMAQPLAYIAGPLVGSIMLFFVPFAYIFPMLAIVLLGAMLPALRIKDTK